jgi:diacylglycerol kinase
MKNRFSSFKYAFHGIAHALRTQPNLWIHAAAAIAVIIAGFYFGISRMEWLAVVFAIGFVICAELVNTAIELFVDMVSPERQEKAGRVKDIAAGAVLIAALTALTIGLFVFVPKF